MVLQIRGKNFSKGGVKQVTEGGGMRKLIMLLCLCILLAPSALIADPCLVVYPDAACTYHYDPTEYYTVGPGHPLYDPMYDRGGEVLLEVGTNEVDMSIYQAPNLIGFESSIGGNDGYFFEGTDFTLYVDGFSNQPTTYVNILIVFDQTAPPGCTPHIWVEGVELTGNTYDAGDLVVSTPTPEGNNYSDVMTFDVSWYGCYGMHIWAFSDENDNGIKDGGECFTAYSHDIMVPVESTSWGAVKSLFK